MQKLGNDPVAMQSEKRGQGRGNASVSLFFFLGHIFKGIRRSPFTFASSRNPVT